MGQTTRGHRSTRAREIPALIFALVWMLGYEVTPLVHLALHDRLGAHTHGVAAHCHGAFCHADDEGPAATKSSSDPLSHAQGSLEHRGVAVLAPDLTIYVPELMLAGELAHGGADEFATLGILAEWLEQASLNLLSTTPTTLGVGRGIAGTIGSAEVDIDPPPAAIAGATRGHQAWVTGSARRASTTIAFEGGLDIADLTVARRVQGIPASGSIDDGSTITITAHLRSWLDQMQFDRLDAPTTGTTRQIVSGTQPYNAWVLGARTVTAFAVTNGVSR